MKVERNKGKFVPITITIESEEEAEAVWIALFCDVDTALRECFDEKEVGSKKRDQILGILYEIWNGLDDIYAWEEKAHD